MRWLLQICVIGLWTSSLFGEIIESNDIRDLLKYADPDTLFVFDLNDVLMEASQSLGSDHWADFEVKKQMKEKNLSKEEVLESFVPVWHKILLVSNAKPVEPTTVGTIRRLQKANIKLLGLTSRYIEMAYPTHSKLCSIGIDFTKTPVYPLDKEIPGGYAAKYIDGIIFVGLKNDKGLTLMRFLDLIQYLPKKIVFIDDKLKNVQSVEKAVTARGIPFIGLRYGYLDAQEKQFNSAIANIQWEHFGKILPDEKALQLLNCPENCMQSGK